MKEATEQMVEEREHEGLKGESERLGLDPAQASRPCPDESPESRNDRLRSLLAWALAYRSCPDRARLERQGYLFPPVEPDIDPDTDWLRFERWMKGLPVTWDAPTEFGGMTPPELLSDVEIERELNAVEKRLAEHRVLLDFMQGVPRRAIYAYLAETLPEIELEILAPGSACVISGCDGWCPDCFQRRWCELSEEFADELERV